MRVDPHGEQVRDHENAEEGGGEAVVAAAAADEEDEQRRAEGHAHSAREHRTAQHLPDQLDARVACLERKGIWPEDLRRQRSGEVPHEDEGVDDARAVSRGDCDHDRHELGDEKDRRVTHVQRHSRVGDPLDLKLAPQQRVGQVQGDQPHHATPRIAGRNGSESNSLRACTKHRERPPATSPSGTARRRCPMLGQTEGSRGGGGMSPAFISARCVAHESVLATSALGRTSPLRSEPCIVGSSMTSRQPDTGWSKKAAIAAHPPMSASSPIGRPLKRGSHRRSQRSRMPPGLLTEPS
mmetsp:Transcript_18538/g.46429  ORF Transcript_18538/g.46429 Transcript_18538/m.46429 type:complete len:296 (+) Transcript_18538:263-1150(+)